MAEAGTSASDRRCDQVAISIRGRLEGLSMPSDCCIFNIPKRLRQSNEEAYTPCVVAIGPYHRRMLSIKPMEDHKMLYLWKFLSMDDRLEDYISMVKSWENEARSSYDEQIKLNSDEFAEMMLLDGIFMIQIFLMSRETRRRLPNDRIFGRPGMLKDVRRDMTLLENQIPFFVVYRLFEMASGHLHGYPPMTLLELVYEFFSPLTHRMELVSAPSPLDVKHIVDALRFLFLPLMNEAQHGSNEPIKYGPRATELVAAGVKLRRGESTCLSDIEFMDGELKIPRLVLDNTTESFFRNIIVFEQFYYQDENDKNLISYMAFMDHLVDTPADSELLMDKGIIENGLGNKEAATDLINAFCKETSIRRYHFRDLSNKLVKHCERPHNKWKATLKRDYCSNPWVVMSVIAAVVLLLLTVLQTVCSVLSVVQ